MKKYFCFYLQHKLGIICTALAFATLSLVLGFIGNLHAGNSFFESLLTAASYLGMDGIGNESGGALILAQLCAVFFVGLSASTIALGFLGNKLSLWFSNQPIVVVGAGWTGRKIIKSLIEDTGKEQSIILVDKLIDEAYEEYCRSQGIAIVTGDATLSQTLEKAKIAEASKIYIFCGNDGVDMQVAHQASEIIDATRGDSQEKVECFLELGSQQHAALLDQVIAKTSSLVPKVLNVEAITIRLLLKESAIGDFRPEYKADTLHAVVCGWSGMAEECVDQLLNICHFQESKSFQLSILADRHADVKPRFLAKYPVYQEDAEDAGKLVPKAAWMLNEKILPVVRIHELELSNLSKIHYETVLEPVLHPIELKSSRQLIRMFCALPEEADSALFTSVAIPALDHISQSEAIGSIQISTYVPTGDESFTMSFQESMETAIGANKKIECTAFEDFLSNKSLAQIEAQEIEKLAIYINWRYGLDYGEDSYEEKEKKIENSLKHKDEMIYTWSHTSAMHKESSRRAALHGALIKNAIRKNLHQDTENQNRILAKIEHRRWCAEQILRGVRPLTDFPSSAREQSKAFKLTSKEKERIEQWFDQTREELKRSFQGRFYHVDLMPYEDIEETISAIGTEEARKIAKDELDKDLKQIQYVADYYSQKIPSDH